MSDFGIGSLFMYTGGGCYNEKQRLRYVLREHEFAAGANEFALAAFSFRNMSYLFAVNATL